MEEKWKEDSHQKIRMAGQICKGDCHSLEFLRSLASSEKCFISSQGSTLSYLAFPSHCDSKPTHIVVCLFVCFHPPVCTQLSEDDVCDSQIHPGSHLLCLQGSLAQRVFMGTISEHGNDRWRRDGWIVAVWLHLRWLFPHWKRSLTFGSGAGCQ